MWNSQYGAPIPHWLRGERYQHFGARAYDPLSFIFLSIDPLAEKYYGISPYAYCGGNPVNLVDPDGNAIETLWDIASFVTGIKSLASNIKAGNTKAAIADGVGVVLDAAAIVIPGIPGGVGAGLKATRVAEKSVDAIKAADKVGDAAKAGEKLTQKASKFVHGNSAASTKAQHAYDISEKGTDKIVKTGVSGGPIRKKDGKSVRAEKQVRKWNKEAGYEKYESNITLKEPEGEGARARIYDYEKKHAQSLRDAGQLKDDYFHKIP